MDFRETKLNRLIIHKIIGKDNFTSATTELTDNLILINDDIERIIIKRVTDACGKLSKSFIVEIADKDKFLLKAQKMKTANDDEFVEISKTLARNLAYSQTTKNATEGYLLVIQGIYLSSYLNFFILIKASFDDGVKPTSLNGQTTIELIDNLIMSSNQKLFKIGIISESFDENNIINYNCILFDDQIRTGSKPAIYFASDFLGFLVEHNPKIQTEHFYNSVSEFAKSKISNNEIKVNVLNDLSSYLKNYEKNVSAIDFKNRYIPDELKDEFDEIIVDKYPNVFVKDNELIKTKLRVKTLTFVKNSIKVSAPLETFNDSIELIKNAEQLENLQITKLYTILKIKGMPFEQ